MAGEIHIETFSSREAEEIGGLPTTLQHEHRRRGHLPKQSGHPRFDLFEIFKLAFVADVSAFGVGPVRAYQSAEWVAHSALGFALQIEGVVAGATIDGGHPDETFEESRARTARYIFRRGFNRPGIMPNRWALFWSDGKDFFAPSLEEAIGGVTEGDAHFGKPLIAIDTEFLAKRIALKLPRAAVVIEGA